MLSIGKHEIISVLERISKGYRRAPSILHSLSGNHGRLHLQGTPKHCEEWRGGESGRVENESKVPTRGYGEGF